MIPRAKLTEPIIVAGMHRSGTTMLTRILCSLGIYMGRRLSENAESRFFQQLNRDLLVDTGGDWFDIRPATEIIQSTEFVQRHASQLEEQLFNRGRLADFLGKWQWFIVWVGQDALRWGWKDPRNSITLPIWLEVFPDAKIVHIIRNGIDVAISLYRREEDRRRMSRDYSSMTQDFARCFTLWEQYVCSCRKYSRFVPRERYVEICYEKVLQSPLEEVKVLASSLSLEVSREKLAEVVSLVDSSHLRNDILRQKYQKQLETLPSSSLMTHLGYA